MIFIGKVIDDKDEYGAGRLKVRLRNAEGSVSDNNLPYSFPFMPKTVHSVPKKGEAVLILCVDDNPKRQRFYVGPIISQYQNLYKDYHDTSALKMINGIGGPVLASVDNIPDTFGAFGSDDDVTIYGRKNSDIILSDSDLRIRCGARLVNNSDTTDIKFNKLNPSVIKMKYHETPISVSKKEWNGSDGDFTIKKDESIESTINVIAQEINLISTEGSPYVKTSNTTRPQNGNETISDEDIKKFIEEAHPLPYGDTLIRFLQVFVTAFKNHTHKYSQMTPVPDTTYLALESFPLETLLSKNVRIN